MKRSVWVSALITVLLLSACSGKSNENSPPNSNSGSESSAPAASASNASGQTQDEPVEITFWHIFSDTEQGSKTLQSLVDQFQQENPNIKVKTTGYGFFDYQPKLQTATAAGEAPDLAFNDIDNVPLRAKTDTIAKLDDFLAADPILDGYSPSIVERMKYNGSTYAIPFMIDVRMLYYNKQHFREAGLDPEKPPANWDELYDYAQKLTVKKGGGFDRIGFAPSLGNFYFWTMAWTNGGSFFDNAQNPTINSKENVEALNYWVKLQDLYGVKAFQTFNSQVTALNLSPFIAEKASMVVDGNWLTDDIAKNKPDLDYGVAPIPYQTNRTTWSGGFNLEINAKSDPAKQEAAWKLLKFLVSNESTKKYVEETHFISPNPNGMALTNLASDPHFGPFVEESKNIRLRDYVEKAPTWANDVATAVEKAVLHDKTPQEALDEAQKIVSDQIANFK